jgi:heme-degrading monooxygenase HmoA
VTELAAVFAYTVDAEAAPAFEAAYGPDGDWARFFRGGEGYLGTELWRDGSRYLLVDRWRSAADYEAFLAGHADEYRRRSDAASALYREERVVGRFEAVARTPSSIRRSDA